MSAVFEVLRGSGDVTDVQSHRCLSDVLEEEGGEFEKEGETGVCADSCLEGKVLLGEGALHCEESLMEDFSLRIEDGLNSIKHTSTPKRYPR